jgi:hypothetical protein
MFEAISSQECWFILLEIQHILVCIGEDSMADPENHTLHLLREIRSDIDKLENKVDRGFERINKRMDSLQQAMTGESVLGRYAVAEVEDRLAAIETRLRAIETPDEQ